MASRRAAGDDGAVGDTPDPPTDDDVSPGPDPEDDAAPDEPLAPGAGHDDADDPSAHDRAPARRPRRALLDAKTLALCALVALLAAALAAVVADRLIDDGDDDATGTEAPTATLAPARSAPDVTFERFDGTPVTLADYQGQPVVVNFWGSWCVPCVEEMPDLQRVHEALGDQVAFLGVNVRDSPEAATAMVERTGVTYDLARDPEGELGRALEVVSWPTTFLIDAEGTVVEAVHRAVSAELLCDKINQGLLNGQLTECV